MAAPKNMPKDAQVMDSILKEIGITEYEPRVLNQMLEFTYRYVTGVLEDARVFSSHAQKAAIDINDVNLAIKLQADKYFTRPPLREVLVSISAQKNSTPLPLIKSTAGPRLPPDRYTLTACNYRLKSGNKKQRIMPPGARSNFSSLQSTSSVGKFNPQLSFGNKNNSGLSIVTKSGTPAAPNPMRTLTNPANRKSFPTPIINFSNDSARTSAPTVTINPPLPTPMSMLQTAMPTVVNVRQNSVLDERKMDVSEF